MPRGRPTTQAKSVEVQLKDVTKELDELKEGLRAMQTKFDNMFGVKAAELPPSQVTETGGMYRIRTLDKKAAYKVMWAQDKLVDDMVTRIRYQNRKLRSLAKQCNIPMGCDAIEQQVQEYEREFNVRCGIDADDVYDDGIMTRRRKLPRKAKL